MTPEPANGSTPWHQTSLPTINETAKWLSVPTDVLRPLLRNGGLDVGPEDRVPLQVVLDTLEKVGGYIPERLFPVTPRR